MNFCKTFDDLPPGEEDVRDAIDTIVRFFHSAALKSGWWIDKKTGVKFTNEEIDANVVPKKLLMVHTEISEATEAHRTDSMDTHCPEFHGVAVELADALIRIADLAGIMNVPLADAAIAKNRFNQVRPDHKPENRAKKGGKKY